MGCHCLSIVKHTKQQKLKIKIKRNINVRIRRRNIWLSRQRRRRRRNSRRSWREDRQMGCYRQRGGDNGTMLMMAVTQSKSKLVSYWERGETIRSKFFFFCLYFSPVWRRVAKINTISSIHLYLSLIDRHSKNIEIGRMWIW